MTAESILPGIPLGVLSSQHVAGDQNDQTYPVGWTQTDVSKSYLEMEQTMTLESLRHGQIRTPGGPLAVGNQHQMSGKYGSDTHGPEDLCWPQSARFNDARDQSYVGPVGPGTSPAHWLALFSDSSTKTQS